MNSIEHNTLDDQSTMHLTAPERALLAFVRQLGYGRVEITVVNGIPVMIERSIEKIKLTS